MPVVFRAVNALTSFAHPGHIVHLCSRGFTNSSPSCNAKSLGYFTVLHTFCRPDRRSRHQAITTR
ncbi:hypothetical protein BZK41_03250 [Citrobacter sp. A316]|nr:hypothetical protein BZK41_03250 [Citrobacter sp. A316]